MTTVRVRDTLALLGEVIALLSVTFIPPALVAAVNGEPLTPFVIPAVLALAAGAGLRALKKNPEIEAREAFLFVSLAWLTAAVLGALPYIINGSCELGDPVNALFESMSGFTTTGATVVQNYSCYPTSIMFWRQLTQWIGGMGIVVLAIAILPRLALGGTQLMKLEAPGPELEKLTPHIRRTARIFWLIYAALTALEVLTLTTLHYAGLAPNMSPYNALIHAFTTMSTGGFSPYPQSIAAFSPAAQWAITGFMIAAGTNFTLFWYLIMRDFRIVRNEEFRWYAAIMTVAAAAAAATLINHYHSIGEAFRQAAFQVASITTTTGYATDDFSKWPQTTQLILLTLMFVGGCAGSTAGGIKVVRWAAALKAAAREIYLSMRPSAVKPVYIGGKPVPEGMLRSVNAFIITYLAVFLAGTLAIAGIETLAGHSLTIIDAATASIATLGNIGPGLGVVGPASSYAPFTAASKIVMTVLMWAGRLEVIALLAILTPRYWRE